MCQLKWLGLKVVISSADAKGCFPTLPEKGFGNSPHQERFCSPAFETRSRAMWNHRRGLNGTLLLLLVKNLIINLKTV
jgi:hypothetical protein